MARQLIDELIDQVPPMNASALEGENYQFQPYTQQAQPISQQPQTPSGQKLASITQQMAQNNQVKPLPASVMKILQERSAPNMQDAAQYALRIATPSFNNPASIYDIAKERMASELSPYTTQLAMQKEMADSTYRMRGGATPAQVKEWEYYSGLSPDQQKEYKGLKRSDKILNLGGQTMVVPPSGGQGVIYQHTPKPEQMPDFKGQQKFAEETQKTEAERSANVTKQESLLKGFEQDTNLVLNAIKEAEGKISNWSTGYGAYLSALPNTEAGELNLLLDQIKSNIGFDKLQQMREASPTGGALGQVSDFENRLLQAVKGALDPRQRNLLQKNLSVIKELYPKVLEEKRRAFQQDYGKYSKQAPSSPDLDKGFNIDDFLARKGIK